MNGGNIGNAAGYAALYGGNIYGASRGNINNALNLGSTAFLHATSIWTDVQVKNGHIYGNIFGGGESGEVKRDTRVVIGGATQTPTPTPAQGVQIRSTQPAATQQQQSTVQPSSQSQNGSTNAATESEQNRTINRTRQ